MDLDLKSLIFAPSALLMVDRELNPLSSSRKGFSVFGVRAHSDSFKENLSELSEALKKEDELCVTLKAEVDRLRRPGSESQFQWERGSRTYEVTVGTLDRSSQACYLVFLTDVTQQIQFEATRELARRYLEDILNNVQLGVVVLNKEMRITNMNRAQEAFLQRLGVFLSWVEAIGMPVSELVPADSEELWNEITDQVLTRGEGYKDTRRVYPTPEGDLILSVDVTPLKNQNGEVIGAIQVSEDVTERVRLEQELREAEIITERLEAVRETAITVNHEINNPLTTILGAAQVLLLSQEELSEKIRGRLQLIEQEVKRIAKVTERLRTMDELKTDDYITDGPKMIDLGMNGD